MRAPTDAGDLKCEDAAFRPDPHLTAELGDIDEDPTDAAEHPTSAGGVLSRQWCEPRRIGAANLTGWYAVPADTESLPTLRSRFLSLAVRYRMPDVDAAAIRQAEPRALTQAIAAWLYEQSDPRGDAIAGVQFDSRHGDGLRLWAVFERPGDGDVSSRFADADDNAIDTDDADMVEAMRIHSLQWAA